MNGIGKPQRDWQSSRKSAPRGADPASDLVEHSGRQHSHNSLLGHTNQAHETRLSTADGGHR